MYKVNKLLEEDIKMRISLELRKVLLHLNMGNISQAETQMQITQEYMNSTVSVLINQDPVPINEISNQNPTAINEFKKKENLELTEDLVVNDEVNVEEIKEEIKEEKAPIKVQKQKKVFELRNFEILKTTVENDFKLISKRINLMKIKQKADEDLKKKVNLPEVQRLYQEILSKDPKNVKVMSNLGMLHLERGEWEQSLELFRACEKLIEEQEALFQLELTWGDKSYLESIKRKLILRKAKAYEIAGQLQEALEQVKVLLRIDYK